MKKPYELLVRQLVFEPLGLNHSYTGTDKLPEPRPSGHVVRRKGLEQRNFSGPGDPGSAGPRRAAHEGARAPSGIRRSR